MSDSRERDGMRSTSHGTEFWLLAWPLARHTAGAARFAESTGWDGVLVTDTQCLAAESLVQLALCVAATERIQLGTGVTNPVTRDPAVLASAMAALQQESRGRMHIGLGRGDSSLAYLGLPPAPISEFGLFLERLQCYLRGETCDRNGFPSRLAGLPDPELPKVPVEVAGTGRRIMELAAERADGIVLAVGAYPDRIRAKVDQMEALLAAAGRSREEFTISAYVNVGAHDSRDTARHLVRGSTSVFARFSGLHGGAAGADLAEDDRRIVVELAGRYRMEQHASSLAEHALALPGTFVDRFAVVGTTDEVGNRLEDLAAAKLDRLILIPGSRDVASQLVEEGVASLAADVLPRFGRRSAGA